MQEITYCTNCSVREVRYICSACWCIGYCSHLCASEMWQKRHSIECNPLVDVCGENIGTYWSDFREANADLPRVYGANTVSGVAWLVSVPHNTGPVFVLGRERGGRYANKYNLFGGAHDKTRSRFETAIAEFNEEFGFAARFDTPILRDVLSAPKILMRGTIIILYHCRANVSRKAWNRAQRKIMADPNISRSFKEMDRIQLVNDFAMKDAVKHCTTSVVPTHPDNTTRIEVSPFVIDVVRSFMNAGYI